jgi:mono/diheme cytochrome c family protein
MKRIGILVALAGLLSGPGIFSAGAQTNIAATTAPVYAADYTHAGESLPEGVFAFDALLKAADATNGQDFASFTFSFTNVTTNIVAVLAVQPGCHCTTVELPPTPWRIPPGSNGLINLKIDLAGKSGELFKSVFFVTEKGRKELLLRVNILPPPPMPEMSEEQRAAGMKASKADRQAVFKADCASCHLPKVEGKYGQQLYEALCTICHEAQHRATMVPDLHALQVPTNEEFWRTWISAGKAGSLMPAFSTAQGGPLNDMQIQSMALYLNTIMPSHVPPPAQTPAK